MLLATLLIITMLLAVLPQAVPFTPPAPAPAPPVVAPDFGRLPLAFVPNAGQTNPDVQFQARGMGGTIFFTSEEVVLSLPTADQPSAPVAPERHHPANQRLSRRAEQPAPTVVRLQFAGANPSPTVTGGEQLPGVVNSFIGNDPTQWRTNLPTYAGVVYDDLYDGIDLRYDGTEGRLKGTYTVAPGGDPAQIRWHYTGAEQVQVDAASGDLVLTLPSQATLTEQAPVAWQIINGTRVPVAAHYSVADDGSIGFALGHYDVRYPLTIDPTLEYSTYLGGITADYGLGIAVDSAGNAYVTGYTTSDDFPTAHPLDGTRGSNDAFVAKLTADGRTLVYSTYLGGSGSEYGQSIAVDSAGNAYVTGSTASDDFPTANALQSTYEGADASGYGGDAFVAKLTADGSGLVYSTYLGGSGGDYGQSIAVDSASQAHVTGGTRSFDFPTVNPLQATYGSGLRDAFVAKLTADGRGLIYSTYLGGMSEDGGTGITVDSEGYAYVTGSAESGDFPTAYPLQATYAGGGTNGGDAFVAKLRVDGSGLIYSTYLGSKFDDSGSDIAVDSAGNAYITGSTFGNDFPIARPLQGTSGGSDDAFVAKLNASGSALVYSTYLGGRSQDHGRGIAVDSAGNAYVTGETASDDFPTAHPLHGTRGGDDAFVAKLTADGRALVYSTYLGGSGYDYGQSIAVDSAGNAYVTGYTYADDFPIARPLQGTSGGSDVFVAKIGDGDGGDSGSRIVVRNDNDVPVSGAQVYRNGSFAGTTSASGELFLPDLASGDELVARQFMQEVDTKKGSHDGWAYRVYITSVDIPDGTGNPQPFTVVDTATTQVLTIKKSNTLIGFNIVASVEWDASEFYLNQLRQGFQDAATYLYDATDGQMLFERVAIYDNYQHWADADYQFHAEAGYHAYVKNDIGHMREVNDNRIYFGRARYREDVPASYQIDPLGARGFVHEFAHYGLTLGDDYYYKTEKGSWLDAACTSGDVRFDANKKQQDETNASIMYYPLTTSEFSMRGVTGLWDEACQQTHHWQERGMSQWEALYNDFSDDQGRWRILTPQDHGGVVAGPDSIPVSSWASVAIDGNADTACTQGTILRVKNWIGQPVQGAEVWLTKADGRRIYQGLTDANGEMEIVGASNGDRVKATTTTWYGLRTLKEQDISCPAVTRTTSPTSANTMDIVLEQAAFDLHLLVTPGVEANTITINVRSSVPLADAPDVEMSHTGTSVPITIPLTYDADQDLYHGTAAFDFSRYSSAIIHSVATDTQQQSTQTIERVTLSQISHERDQYLPSTSGPVRLYLPTGSLSENAVIVISSNVSVAPPPVGYVFASTPYTIRSAEDITLAGKAGLTLAFDQTIPNTDDTTIRIFHWDTTTGQWSPLESAISLDWNEATTSISSFGTYAVMVRENHGIYLPLISR
jgi:hypothetical protein